MNLDFRATQAIQGALDYARSCRAAKEEQIAVAPLVEPATASALAAEPTPGA